MPSASGSTPPIATPYASTEAVIADPGKHDWGLTWSIDGESVLATRDNVPWCFMIPDNGRGFCRAIAQGGPWGEPWSQAVFDGVEWNSY